MDPKDFPHLSRRGFLRQAACAAVGTLALKTTIRDLRFINTAAGQGTLNDYKALVCIFLSGGNDANNLIIPRGAEYGNYSAIRQNLAIPEARVLPITSLNGDGRLYGFHPGCVKLQTLFGEGKLAPLFNVGTLLHPLTRSQYQTKSVATPPQLFSHSDQVTQWQTSIPDQPPRTGWGGRVADLIHPSQYTLQADGTPTANSAKISLCTSVAGSNTFEVGSLFQQYQVSTAGAVTLSGVTNARLQAVKDILALPDANLQRNAYADVVEHAIATGSLLNTAIAGTVSGPYAGGSYWADAFPNTTLGNQLKMVARMIQARAGLGMKRQIFFCSVGGYDTHTAQTGLTAGVADSTVGSHANLLAELSDSLFAFQRAMEQLGTSANVTSFTASDFGRTFPTNGQGSDHGWGNHQLIMGGAVRGQRTYGSFPIQTVNGPDDTSTGRWIPRTSVDQYSATLAKWFGVTPGNIESVFPNIGRFATPDLGFMG
ncbi:MAG: hypothetical protein JWL90_3114 [Chthoniobacteraceae bacterium]|nr:hypothetical protein [Chthoniobacteraceae bacterium]